MSKLFFGRKKDWRFYCSIPFFVFAVTWPIASFVGMDFAVRYPTLYEAILDSCLDEVILGISLVVLPLSVVCAISWNMYDENGNRRGSTKTVTTTTKTYRTTPEKINTDQISAIQTSPKLIWLTPFRKTLILISVVAFFVIVGVILINVGIITSEDFSGILFMVLFAVCFYKLFNNYWYGGNDKW